MDVGPAKQRARSTADVVKIESVSIHMTATQLATFDAFFRETLGFGAITFEWVHPRTGNPVDARFVEAPKYVALAPRQTGSEVYRVDMVLELLPGTEVIAPPPPPPPPDIPGEQFLVQVDAGPGDASPSVLAWIGIADEPDPPAPVAGDDDFFLLAGPRPGFESEGSGAFIDETSVATSYVLDPPVSMPVGGGAA